MGDYTTVIGTASQTKAKIFGTPIWTPGVGDSPTANGEVLLQRTTNTSLNLVARGSDGVTRNLYLGVNSVASSLSLGYLAAVATTGTYNTSIGNEAGRYITIGYENTGIGAYANRATVNGYANTALGYFAMQGNVAGCRNVAVGRSAMHLTEGNDNVAVGYNAGRNIYDGSTYNTAATGCIYLGYAARASTLGQTKEYVIGNVAIGRGSNTFTVGDATQTSAKLFGTPIWTPQSSVTPSENGELLIEATSNTSVTIKLKGTDGVVRSVVLTLS
jgi:hypothetical protein